MNLAKKFFRTGDILEEVAKRDTDSKTIMHTGFYIVDVPSNAKSEKEVGIDYFPTKESVMDYLNLTQANPINLNDYLGDWKSTVIESNDKTKKESNCIFSASYILRKMSKNDAIEFLDGAIDMVKNNSGPIMHSGVKSEVISSTKTSKMFLIENKPIEIDITYDKDICGYPKSVHRLLYLFECFSFWLENFKNKWISIDISKERKNTFKYSFETISGWHQTKPTIFSQTSFNKDLDFSKTAVWMKFFAFELTPQNKANIVLSLLKEYGLNSSYEDYNGIFGDDKLIVNFLKMNYSLKNAVLVVGDEKRHFVMSSEMTSGSKAILDQEKRERDRQKIISNQNKNNQKRGKNIQNDMSYYYYDNSGRIISGQPDEKFPDLTKNYSTVLENNNYSSKEVQNGQISVPAPKSSSLYPTPPPPRYRNFVDTVEMMSKTGNPPPYPQ